MSNNAVEYGLHYVAEHNAHFDDEPWNDPFNFDLEHTTVDQAYTYPDPQQSLPSVEAGDVGIEASQDVIEAVRTRSGRVTRRTQSPNVANGVNKSRSSNSPRPKRTKVNRKDKVKTVHLPGPLSEITESSSIPVRDIDAWVNRPAEDRIEESRKRKGYIARPMNSFMLYRSAYAERTKEWCKENNHQVVSSVAGESWPMESDELRNQYNAWAKLERDNHAAAFPHYKFSPSKTGGKKKEEDVYEPDPDQGDSDAEYVPSRRVQRQYANQHHPGSMRSASPAASDAYSSGVEYDQSNYQWIGQPQMNRPLPAPYNHMSPYAPPNTSYPYRSYSFQQPPQPHQQQMFDPIHPGYSMNWDPAQMESSQTTFFPPNFMQQPQPQQQPQRAMNFNQSLQSPRFAYVDSNGVPEWHDFGVDPRLTTSELDAGYSRDLDRDRNAQ
ncbi:HMG-box-containing protein [Elsinoe fawcettii]|nr:HMG-box-containing protein [Elsinoe fawcettii]